MGYNRIKDEDIKLEIRDLLLHDLSPNSKELHDNCKGNSRFLQSLDAPKTDLGKNQEKK
jgi:hypothetical protein